MRGEEFWDDKQSTVVNLWDHAAGIFWTGYTLAAIHFGMRQTAGALNGTFLADLAVLNLRKTGCLITKEAIAVEVATIRATLKGGGKVAYHGALKGGEYLAFWLADITQVGAKEIASKGVLGADYGNVFESTSSVQAHLNRAAFLVAYSAINYVTSPVKAWVDARSRRLIHSAHQDLFDTYEERTRTALSHLEGIANRRPEEVDSGEIAGYLKEASEAVEARIELEEQLPPFAQDGRAILEGRAVLAELRAAVDGTDGGSMSFISINDLPPYPFTGEDICGTDGAELPRPIFEDSAFFCLPDTRNAWKDDIPPGFPFFAAGSKEGTLRELPAFESGYPRLGTGLLSETIWSDRRPVVLSTG